jgi:hypothetical protein
MSLTMVQYAVLSAALFGVVMAPVFSLVWRGPAAAAAEASAPAPDGAEGVGGVDAHALQLLELLEHPVRIAVRGGRHVARRRAAGRSAGGEGAMRL